MAVDSVSALQSAQASSSQAAGTAFAMNVLSSMKELDDLDYELWRKWKLHIQLILSLIDMDCALLKDNPDKLTNGSSPEERSNYEKWERSNRLCLLLMKSKMASHLCGCVPNSEYAKEYFDGIQNLVMKCETECSDFLMDELEKARYDGKGNVRQHVMKLYSIAKRLIAMGSSSAGLVHFIISSLPPQFRKLKIVAKIRNWGVDELISKCGYWEEYLRQNGNDGNEMDDFEDNDDDYDSQPPQ